jgi:hypothetical protein
MTEMVGRDPALDWTRRWRAARTTIVTALSWILTLPVLARLMRWSRKTAIWVQNILGPITGLIWGRIGWVGVRHYGFSNEDAFLAGGLAGALAPTVELALRRLGWPPGPEVETEVGAERPPLIAFPFAWFWGFLVGGLMAALGAVVARWGSDDG